MKRQSKENPASEPEFQSRSGNGDPRHMLTDGETLLAALRLGEVGAWRWRIDSDELWWSENLEDFHLLPRFGFDGTLSSFQRDIHPDDADAVWKDVTRSVETGLPYRTVYRTAPRDGYETRWLEAAGGIVDDAWGERYLTGTCIDVTRRVHVEMELERRLRQQQFLRALSSFALDENDFGKIMRRAVLAAAEIFEVPLVKILKFSEQADHLIVVEGVGWDEGVVGQATVGIDKESQAGYTLNSKLPVVVSDLSAETRFSGPELLVGHQVVSGMSTVIAGEDGSRPFGVLGVHSREARNFESHDVDILTSLANIVARAARHHSFAKRQDDLMREMAHRAGNLLQVVNSIANRTLLNSTNQGAARGAFVSRLQALSRINQLIATSGWQSVRFRDLVRESLDGWADKAHLAGRDILLPAELCFDLGLAMHEICTNSAKYGSLGRDNGTIRIQWEIQARPDVRCLKFEWSDSISAAPRESGYGSAIIKGLIQEKWNGTIEESSSEGYHLGLDIPLRKDMQQ